MRISTVFAGDISDLLSLSTTVVFEDVKLSLVGHMESNFNALDETSTCMSTACVVHSSGGFDASGRNVHTILVLWKIRRKCCETRLLKPLHTLQPFRNLLEMQELQDLYTRP